MSQLSKKFRPQSSKSKPRSVRIPGTLTRCEPDYLSLKTITRLGSVVLADPARTWVSEAHFDCSIGGVGRATKLRYFACITSEIFKICLKLKLTRPKPRFGRLSPTCTSRFFQLDCSPFFEDVGRHARPLHVVEPPNRSRCLLRFFR